MKKSTKIILIVVLVFFALSLTKDLIIKTIVQSQASQVLGAPVSIQWMNVGLLKQSVRIKGLKVGNPQGFPQETMIDIPEAGVDFDLQQIMKGNLHLPMVILNLKEFVVIKNKAGQLNVDALKVAQKKEEPKGEPKEKGPAKNIPMQLDEVVLNLGKVVVKDEIQGSVQAFDINVRNKTYKNITSAHQLTALLMIESLKPTAIKNAAIYGAASVLGVAFLPAGVAGVLLSKDSAVGDFRAGFGKVYEASREILTKGGSVESEDRSSGRIKGKFNGANITIDLTDKGSGVVEVKISARKMLLPKSDIANGLLYNLEQKIGK